MVLDNTKPVTEQKLMETLMTFFEKVLSPIFERIENKLEDHDKKFISVDQRLNRIEGTLQDVHRRVIDLERDTITDKDFKKLEKRVEKVEKTVESN